MKKTTRQKVQEVEYRCGVCGTINLINPGSLLAHLSHQGKTPEENRKRLEKANLARRKKLLTVTKKKAIA